MAFERYFGAWVEPGAREGMIISHSLEFRSIDRTPKTRNLIVCTCDLHKRTIVWADPDYLMGN